MSRVGFGGFCFATTYKIGYRLGPNTKFTRIGFKLVAFVHPGEHGMPL